MAAVTLIGKWAEERRRNNPRVRTLPRHEWERYEWAWLGALTVAAFAVRVIHLSSVPPGLWYDEGSNGMEIVDILGGRLRGVYSPLNNGQATLYFYLAAIPVFLGRLVGEPIVGLRVVSALIGALTPAALYFAARRSVGKGPAFAAALMLAFSRWHITFSRLAFMAIQTPLYGLLGFAFFQRWADRAGESGSQSFSNFWEWLRSGLARHREAVIAGFFFGLSFHTYLAAYFTVVAAVIVSLVLAMRSGWRRTHWVGLRWGAGVVLACAVPIAAYAAVDPHGYFGRSHQVSLFSGHPRNEWWSVFVSNARDTVQMFLVLGDGNPRHNLPSIPMLDEHTAMLFVAGAACALFQLPRTLWLISVLWLPIMLLPGVLSIEAPHALRCLGAVAPVYLLIAAGFESFVAAGEAFLGYAGRVAVSVVLLPVAALTGRTELSDYFLHQMKDDRVWEAHSTVIASIAHFTNEQPKDSFVIADYFDDPVFRFMTRDRHLGKSFDPVGDIPYRGDLPVGESGVTYFLAPFQEASLEKLRGAYPGVKLLANLSPFGKLIHYTAVISQDEILHSRGWKATYALADGKFVKLTESNAGAAPPPGARSGEWTGLLYAPVTASYRFRRAPDGDGTIAIDGRDVEWGLPGARVEEVMLVRGEHPFRVRYERLPAKRPLVRWERAGAKFDEETDGLPLPGPTPGAIPPGFVAPRELSATGWGAAYYENASGTGAPLYWAVDRKVDFRWERDPVSTPPWTGRWRGILRTDRPGKTTFYLSTNDYAALFLDGEKKVEVRSGTVYGEDTGQVDVRLASGPRLVEVRYVESRNYSRLRLLWKRPGDSIAADVPPEAVRPIPPWENR